jgi:hypothetical protein
MTAPTTGRVRRPVKGRLAQRMRPNVKRPPRLLREERAVLARVGSLR